MVFKSRNESHLNCRLKGIVGSNPHESDLFFFLFLNCLAGKPGAQFAVKKKQSSEASRPDELTNDVTQSSGDFLTELDIKLEV